MQPDSCQKEYTPGSPLGPRRSQASRTSYNRARVCLARGKRRAIIYLIKFWPRRNTGVREHLFPYVRSRVRPFARPR